MMVVFCVIGILAIGFLCLLLYHNRAFPEAQEIAEEMERVGSDYYFYGSSKTGFIIFSGAKTDEKAYTYLAKLLHEEGHTVVIPKQLFYLSMFGTKHGMEILESNSQIENWILIGHSLGGMPVSRIAAAQPKGLIGVALLATYASVDLSGLDIRAIRITADHDGIMNNTFMEKYNVNLPANSSNIVLEGANHQGFAAYSSSSGRDGKASISWKEQNEQTIRLILDYFMEMLSAPLRSALSERPLDVQRPRVCSADIPPKGGDATRRGKNAPPYQETLRVWVALLNSSARIERSQ